MRKKILSLAMLTLLIISVVSVLNIVDVSATPYPVIEFSPNSILTGSIGTILVWPISTDYIGSDIWGYEFSITYNPVVLEVLNVTNGGVVANKTGITSAKFINGSIDNDAGKLSVTTAYFYFVSPPPNVTSGAGTLATVTFNVTGNGDSDITFEPGTKLTGWNASAVETYNIIDDTSPSGSIVDGYFRNMIPGHNVRINSVSANESSVLSGELVNVTVNAENTGNVTEKFGVTAYYSTVPIGKQTITLGAGADRDLYFIWDTTPARFNLTLSAKASTVGSAYYPETSTTDNTKVGDTVTVTPPTLAVDPDEVIDTTMVDGDTFVVNITITDAYDLSETVFNVTWDPLVLTALSIVEGDFLDPAATFTAITTTHDDILYNMTMATTFINYSHSVGVTGSGTLAKITFEVQSRGGSVIELRPHPTWWTTYWATTPVVVDGVHSNLYDMDFHPPGNYRWIFDLYTVQDWAYPTWTNLYRITVNPINNGFLHMAYNLTIYVNGTIAESRVLTLVGKKHGAANKRTETFEWNITGLDYGTYPITANITDQDPDLDDDPNNDDYVFGTPTTIRIPGDTDGDADVDSYDFYQFSGKYGLDKDDMGFDRYADIDGDGDVDSYDFYLFSGKYGQSITGGYP
jgi:hypothetical protein